MQFLVGCAHLRKQPLFQGACETAFEKCRDPETSEISRAQLADVLRLSMLLPSGDRVKSLLPLYYSK
jgi:lysophosphatidylcholine acyltransferase / lyso-PAF acetyltransferase